MESKDIQYIHQLEELLRQATDTLVALQISQGLIKDVSEPAQAVRPDTEKYANKNLDGKANANPDKPLPRNAGGAQNNVPTAGGSNDVMGQSQGTSKQGNKSGEGSNGTNY